MNKPYSDKPFKELNGHGIDMLYIKNKKILIRYNSSLL